GVDANEAPEHLAGARGDFQDPRAVLNAGEGERDLVGFLVEEERRERVDTREQIVDATGRSGRAVEAAEFVMRAARLFGFGEKSSELFRRHQETAAFRGAAVRVWLPGSSISIRVPRPDWLSINMR